jgi:uroporphyrinogen-III decarboxylase
MIIDFLPMLIRCGMSFSSDWFFHNIGTKYDKKTMDDPILRLEMEQKQGEFIRKKYPEFHNNISEYKKSPNLGIGVATVPKCWGCEVKYQDHMNPFALSLLKDGEDPMTLKEPNLNDTMQWLFEEIDIYVEAGWNKTQIGLPDLQGPLNVSMKLVGDNKMLSLIARRKKEKEVNHILEVASNTYIDVYKALRKATGKPERSNFSVSGCTYYYISPAQWKKYILPIVKKCEALGDRIRLHHCGQADSDRIQAYAEYQWSTVEFGFGSDLKLARELMGSKKYGPIDISCRVSPYRMLNQTAEQIKKDIEWIIDNATGGPMSINCVGVPWKTPEDNLWAMYNTIQEFHKKKEAEMEDDDD